MSAIKYWLWLAAETAVSPRSKIALLSHYGDPERAFLAPKGEFQKIEGITEGDAKKLEARDISRTEDILEACDRSNISIITLHDAFYPTKLKNISAPPVVLFVRGNISIIEDTLSVSVIGTRSADAYGVKMAKYMGAELARGGAVIVNGLSGPIEINAVREGLMAGGKCVAVLGTAHSKEPTAEEADVALYGAVVSEYPPNTVSQKSFFRDRNRITAGLSDAVLAIEAPIKSGTLLFADEALNQGREIYAVPSNVDSINGKGTNLLIAQGAKLTCCAWDVLEDYTAIYPNKLRKVGLELEKAEPETVVVKQQTVKKEEKVIDKNDDAAYIDFKEQLKALSADQLKIITAIDKSATHVDDIVAETGLSVAKVLGQLTVLEIKGYIKRRADKTLVLNLAKK